MAATSPRCGKNTGTSDYENEVDYEAAARHTCMEAMLKVKKL